MSWSSTGSSYTSPAELMSEVRRRLARLGLDNIDEFLSRRFALLGDKSLTAAIADGEPVSLIDRVVAKVEELQGNRNLWWFVRPLRPSGGDPSADAVMGELLLPLDPTRTDGGAQPVTIGLPVVFYSNAHGGLVSPADAQGPAGLLWTIERGGGAADGADVIVVDGRPVSLRITGATGHCLEVVEREYRCGGAPLAVTGMNAALAERVEQALESVAWMIERGGQHLEWILEADFDA